MRLLTALAVSLVLGFSFATGAIADGKSSSQPSGASAPESSQMPLDDYLGGCSSKKEKPIS